MIKKLQKKYALSEQGAKDLIKGCLACVPSESVFYVPSRTFILPGRRSDERGCSRWENSIYVAGCVVCIGLILLTTFFQYNATYFATYKESGIAALPWQSICEKSPFPFSGKRI